jgi:hypothetical protein
VRGTPTDLSPDHGIVEWHRFAVRPEEAFGLRRGRCGLAPVEGHDIRAVPMHDEGTAADTGVLGFDEVEDELYRHAASTALPPAARISRPA